MQRRYIRGLLTVVGLALLVGPPLVYLVHLHEFGRLPSRDYYGVLDQLAHDRETLDLSPSNLLRLKSNEHTVTLPGLVYAANVALTDGDNRALSAFVLLLIAAMVVLLVPVVKRQLGEVEPRAPAVFLLLGVVSVFLFNLAQVHNVVLGFSGTMWILSNVLAVAAIVALSAHGSAPRGVLLGATVLAASLGALTYSSNLSLWPALLVGAALLRLPGRDWAALLTATGWAYVFYLVRYRRPGHHPEIESSPEQVLEFAATYLGALFTSDRELAAVIGVLGLLAAVATWGVVLRHRGEWQASAPLVMLQVYVIGNALGTAAGRAGIGIEVAMASRYANLPALFWLALALAWASLLFRDRRIVPLWRWLAVVLVASATWVVIHRHSIKHYEAFLQQAEREPVAVFAIRHGLFDRELLASITPSPAFVARVSGFMRRAGHVPFDEETDLVIDEPAPVRELPWGAEPAAGRVEILEPIDPKSPRLARVKGWTHVPDQRVRRVLFTDSRGRLVGAAFPGFHRSDVARRRGIETLHSGFLGALLLPENGELSAWVESRQGEVAPLRIDAGAPDR